MTNHNLELSELDLFEIQKDVYKTSLYDFFLDAVKVHKPGTDFIENWHIKYICDRLEAEAKRVYRKEKRIDLSKHFLIGVPPRSTKSVLISIIFPVWVWTFYPECKFITCTYSPTLAEEFAVYSRDIITSDWYQTYFGDVDQLKDDSNARSHYKNTKGGERLAKGRTGVTGHGGDILILDDSIDPQKVSSQAEIKEANTFYSEVFSNRLDQQEISFLLVTGQRVHENDTIGYILENYPEDFEHICIPAELSDNVSPAFLADYYVDGLYFPARFSERVLSIEKKKGQKYYATQFQQQPAPADGIVFKPSWFPILTKEEYATIVAEKKIKPRYNIFIDPAMKTDDKNDFTAIVVTQFHEGIHYVVDSRRIKKATPDILKCLATKLFPTYLKPNSGSKVHVEDAANGSEIILRLIREYHIPALKLSHKNKPKIERADAVTVTCEAMCVRLVKHNSIEDNIKSDEQVLLDQLTMFPLAKHDDLVDAFVYALATKIATSIYTSKPKTFSRNDNPFY